MPDGISIDTNENLKNLKNIENLEKVGYHLIQRRKPGHKMAILFKEYKFSSIELKALNNAVDWGKAAVVRISHHGTTLTLLRGWVLDEFRKSVRNRWAERLRALESRLKSAARTPTAVYYVKLIALRELQRMHVLLRQQLASSAPVERLVLRDRPRHLLVARPPIAPPDFA